MNRCVFKLIEGTQADYVCQACGRVVERVPALPLIADCGSDARCKHFGPELRRVECPTCCGSVKLKVFACAVHGESTMGQPIDGLACCAGCLQFEPGLAAISRNQSVSSKVRIE